MTFERIVTGGILAFGLTFLFLVMPQQVETVSYGRVVPSTLPGALLWIITIAAAVQMVTLKDDADFNTVVVIRAVGLLALMVAAVWSMDRLYFEYVAPVLALILMLFMGERRWYWLLLGGVAIPLGIWLLVERILDRTLA
ncbi:tripartite tricarboxylate transporter TctB family protein [Leisingera sp. ANG59]|uniref:tripartite tricarboxylate transporter TctB family protein n=1 Tax=Leisingera sp. ANG59 TaxID=2675221 RepID=UPI0015742CC8|nr:tripartite tricarboxylate transporter TctB family protein [Leisingera sp. ANG59]NSY40385.1 hypothetical protein [Leisingera sp. ANG59]